MANMGGSLLDSDFPVISNRTLIVFIMKICPSPKAMDHEQARLVMAILRHNFPDYLAAKEAQETGTEITWILWDVRKCLENTARVCGLREIVSFPRKIHAFLMLS